MLPDKAKHGVKRSGKGGKDNGGKVMPSGSKVKEMPHTPPIKIKIEEGESSIAANSVSPSVVRTADNAHLLPRYTVVLTRSKEDTVGVDELDGLQLELETLLSCAAMRHRALLEDIALSESLDERHKKKLASTKGTSSTPTSLLKRSAVRADSRPVKKIKVEGVKADVPAASAGKLNRLRSPPGDDSLSPKPELPEVPKNDLPDKFWASVEPYCRAITADDISYLQDLIRIREEERNGELYNIPPLGKHYTLRWAEADVQESAVKRQPTHLSGTAGPMTQRLVAALVEERAVSTTGLEAERSKELSIGRTAALAHVKSAAFESRVREELREQGILDGDEAPKEQADDELLLEMKRCQSELKALASHNLQRLRHLLQLAEAQMERQQLKQKLHNINQQIVKMHAYKMEKKHLTKKEKETSWRLIKELKATLKELYPSQSSKVST